jgi:hypothetical protein
MAQPGKPLLSLYDPKTLRVVASIPQARLAQLRGAVAAKIEFPESGRWVDGASIQLLPQADPITHVVKARVGLPAQLEGVLPGMFARAHFVLGTIDKLTVPAAAVVRRGELTAVYVVDPAQQIRLRQVRLGETFAGGQVEVMAGITSGERVALDPIQAGIRLHQQAPRPAGK